jgi:hypothetical protein
MIRTQHQLFIDDVAALAAGAQSSLELIKDEKLHAIAAANNPVALAKRLETIRPKLSQAEWNAGVELWLNYIARSADLWEKTNFDHACDFQDQGKSIAVDAGYIFAWPFVMAEFAKSGGAKKSEVIAGAVVAGPLITTAGVIGLSADVVTFIPNAAANASSRLRTNMHVRRSAKAFRKFADLVVQYEKIHG